MTPHFHLSTRAARRPATSGAVQALLGQDVTPTPRRGGRVNGLQRNILVILHYLLKNNITFMWGMEQGRMPPIAHRGIALPNAQGGGLPKGGSSR